MSQEKYLAWIVITNVCVSKKKESEWHPDGDFEGKKIQVKQQQWIGIVTVEIPV